MLIAPARALRLMYVRSGNGARAYIRIGPGTARAPTEGMAGARGVCVRVLDRGGATYSS